MLKDIQFKTDCDKFVSYLNMEIMEGHDGEVPLKNRYGLIVDFAFVDPEDYENVIKFSWSKRADGYATKGTSDNTEKLMHRFILGNIADDMVVDHKDGNRINNCRSNLRLATREQNAQNKPGTNKYYGVSFDKSVNKWIAKYSNKYLGAFSNAIDAAKRYDTYVFIKLGPEARTNNLVKYNEITLTLEDFEVDKDRDLPKNIHLIKSRYCVCIDYKEHKFYGSSKSLERAKIMLEGFTKQLDEIKLKEKSDFLSRDIKRNEDGLAIINIYNNNQEVIENVIVDDNKWHELVRYRWTKSNKYHQAKIDCNTVYMHRYIVDAKNGDIVDHCNGNRLDNRQSNLRIVDYSINNHNKKGYGSSKFRGVSYSKIGKNWKAEIVKDYLKYNLGHYEKEVQAAIAVNIKAKELYGEHASMNEVSEKDLKDNLPIVLKNIRSLTAMKEKIKPGSKYKGVKKTKTAWQARIKYKYVEQYIGTFNTEKEAAEAYNKRCKELLGDKAKLNIID